MRCGNHADCRDVTNYRDFKDKGNFKVDFTETCTVRFDDTMEGQNNFYNEGMVTDVQGVSLNVYNKNKALNLVFF